MIEKLHIRYMGGFGNQLFMYCFARAYAEKHGLEFWTDDWIGHKIFDLPDRIGRPPGLTNVNEGDLLYGEVNVSLVGYFQRQQAMIYTRKQVKEWLKFKPYIIGLFAHHHETYPSKPVSAHYRGGNYAGYGYPVVSKQSYLSYAKTLGYEPADVDFADEQHPRLLGEISSDISFITDFFFLMAARVLLRANSTFSWWAATLGDGLVYSPVIEGLEGGREHDNVPFVAGNHPRLANLSFVTDLHLPT